MLRSLRGVATTLRDVLPGGQLRNALSTGRDGLFHWALRAASAWPAHTILEMPSLSPTMTKGGLLRWHVEEGTSVQTGDRIAEVETDKATMDFDAMDEGIVAKILIPEGTKDIEVGTPLAVLVEEGTDVHEFRDYQSSAPSAPVPRTTEKTEIRVAQVGVKIGPAARKLAVERGIVLERIQGTGLRGIITKEDVLKVTAAPEPLPELDPEATPVFPPPPVQMPFEPKAVAPASGYRDVPLTQIRRVIAQRLTESKQTIPGIYFRADCELTELQRLRQTLKASGAKVSVNDFVVKAAAMALQDVPSANAYWDSEELVPKQWSSVDVSIAVSTPTGLITPIVKGANSKSIKAIAQEIRELARKARDSELKPEEFMGGTFTISNLGMYGIDHFSAIINPPQSCIMAVGGAQSELGYVQDLNQLEMIPKMSVTLTADHRVFDGEVVHEFLSAFRACIEHPLPLLV